MALSDASVSRRPASFEVIPHGPTFVAEIRGVDFSQPVGDEMILALHKALMEYKVIYFRGVEMTPEAQVAFGRQFGDVTVHPFAAHLEHLPEVLLLDNYEDNPVYTTDQWHTDETFRIDPPVGSILRCVRVPERGGDTVWADMCAAYDGLSDKMQHVLSGLEAVHDFKNFRHKFDHLPRRERYERLAKMEEELPNPTHPVVYEHPVTKAKVLYVNQQSTIAIAGMTSTESRAILDFLFRQPEIPEYQFRFAWEPNAMVFWDNRPTQHYAANDYYPNRRTLHRVTVKREHDALCATTARSLELGRGLARTAAGRKITPR